MSDRVSILIDSVWEIGRGGSLSPNDISSAVLFVISFYVILKILSKYFILPDKFNKLYIFLLLGIPLMYLIHGMMYTIYYFLSLITSYDFTFNGCWGLNSEDFGLDECFYLFPSTSQEISLMMGKWISAPFIGLVFFLLNNKNKKGG
mgnify:CR=1 FL=1